MARQPPGSTPMRWRRYRQAESAASLRLTRHRDARLFSSRAIRGSMARDQEVQMAKVLPHKERTLSAKERTLMDAYWRAANYLSVGQIYLYDNPLLKQP